MDLTATVLAVDDRPRGLALGAKVYLRKPIRREELVDALHQVGAL